MVLGDRLGQALVRLNPDLSAEALDYAFRKLIRPEGATLEARNLATLRETLLPKLISGELRLKDAGKFLGRVSV